MTSGPRPPAYPCEFTKVAGGLSPWPRLILSKVQAPEDFYLKTA
nr:MAG TPA_asm: hypothetical protein [Bacteriophage sp.]